MMLIHPIVTHSLFFAGEGLKLLSTMKFFDWTEMPFPVTVEFLRTFDNNWKLFENELLKEKEQKSALQRYHHLHKQFTNSSWREFWRIG